jgi:FixJ family two-component response regulator
MQTGRVIIHSVSLPNEQFLRISEFVQQQTFGVERHVDWQGLISRADAGVPGCVVASLTEFDTTVVTPWLSKVVEQLNFALVLLLNRPSTRAVVSLLRLGVTDIIDWPLDSARLESTLADACRTATAMQFTMRNVDLARERVAQLRREEREVLELMLQGKLNKNIASSLGIALRTVEARRKRIFTKLGTRSLAEIAILLTDAGREGPRRPHFLNLPNVASRPLSIQRPTS